MDDISDDEEDKEPVKTETERSRSPASREWDLPSESDDSLHLSDGINLIFFNGHKYIRVFFKGGSPLFTSLGLSYWYFYFIK